MISHLQKCIFKYREDIGAWPKEIRISRKCYKDLKEEILRMLPDECEGRRMVEESTNASFWGIPILVAGD